jgi:quercetin dioxygenase-like cupin family protein
MTSPLAVSPIVVRSGEAETLQDGGLSLITLLADADATGAALTANKSTFREGSPGAPAHFHTKATEVFYVLDGRMRFLVGEEVRVLDRGDFLIVPPTVPHAFAPAAGSTAELLVLFTPGLHRFDYYRLLERVHRGEAGVEEIRASSERYDNHYVDSALWRDELSRTAPDRA